MEKIPDAFTSLAKIFNAKDAKEVTDAKVYPIACAPNFWFITPSPTQSKLAAQTTRLSLNWRKQPDLFFPEIYHSLRLFLTF